MGSGSARRVLLPSSVDTYLTTIGGHAGGARILVTVALNHSRVPPGPRPLFTLFATEEELSLLGSKVRAKMGLDKRQASSGRLDVELSGGQPSGTLSRGRSLSGGLSAEVSQRNLLYPPEISRLL